ncbi:unnamed protein product [Lactuca saligna]|uniref:Uncharacterized protein n=1 Tax=Lactuca saligna TaxID=75948 RepID=A0AA35ZWA6_LACSI|nr:unnamed protein product [Lactuca saligna]
MAKQISQREKKKKTRKLVITTTSTKDEDERILETPEANLNKESSTPEQTMVIPPKDSFAKSSHEEARTSYINENVSHIDVNVNMGDGDAETEAQDLSSCTKAGVLNLLNFLQRKVKIF